MISYWEKFSIKFDLFDIKFNRSKRLIDSINWVLVTRDWYYFLFFFIYISFNSSDFWLIIWISEMKKKKNVIKYYNIKNSNYI